MTGPFRTTARCVLVAVLAVASALSVTGTATAAIAPATGRVYTGVSVDGSRGLSAELGAYTAAAGKRPSIVMDYRDWAHNPDFPRDFADLVVARGSTPMLTWEPWDHTAGTDQPAYRLAAIAGGAHDALVRRWAAQVRAWNRPLYLRFAHEMNGDWYPWSERVNGNRGGQYAPAFRRVVDLFRAAGVRNVTWVWSPNVSYPGSTPLRGLYPGNTHVDWTALDGYNWGSTTGTGWQSFEQIFGPSIAEVRGITGRPLMLGEVGATEQGGDKAAWIADFFARLAARPEIRAYVWFNHLKESDWRIQSSAAAQRAYARGVAASRYLG